MTDSLVEKIRTLGVIIKNRERLRLGSNAPGEIVPPEKGRRAIVVPSFGLLEQAEIDYIVEGAKEEEDERSKNQKPSQQKEELENLANAMLKAPEGQRAKTGRQILKEVGRDVSK